MPMNRVRCVALAAAFGVLAGCNEGSTMPTQYVVQYIVSGTGATFDSVKYDNGTGTFVTAYSPNLGVVKTIQPTQLPVTIQATAWVHLDSAGATAKLYAGWFVVGGQSYSDSSMTTASGPSAATLSIPLHNW